MIRRSAPDNSNDDFTVAGDGSTSHVSGNKVKEIDMAAKYGSKAKSKVKKAMHERKRGTLKSGKSGKKVKSRKQAIAIGLSQARRAGGKVPRKPSRKKATSKKK